MIPERIKNYISRRGFGVYIMPAVLFNTAVSVLISFPLLSYGIAGRYNLTALYILVAAIAHYFLLHLAAGLILYIVTAPFGRKTASFINITSFTVLQLILLVDVRIYTIFRFHINALVLNVLTTEGAGDSVILGKGTFLTFTFLALLIAAAEFVAVKFNPFVYRQREGNFSSRAGRLMKVAMTVCALLVVMDKGLYAYGDLYNMVGITRVSKLFPLYQPLTIKRFAADVLRLNVNREMNLRVAREGSMLNYPKEPLRFDEGRNKKFNIILIVMDGLRHDMLNKDVMPNTWAFSLDNIVYTNHFSGGNGTRFGIFSLLYGIHGSYWHSFLAQRQSPLLIDTLIEMGYDFRILSSTRLTFPEFRKTAFVRIPESIKDSFTAGTITEKDRLITMDLLDYLSGRKDKGPFFAFLYYNSSHQPFDHPQKFRKFIPEAGKEIDYFRDIGRERIHLLLNRYRNAVYYEDFLVGQIISALNSHDLLKNSIVVITGDHGEEFYENGYFGHTSAFDDYQLRTVFVMHYPGMGRRSVQRLTSHLDLVPTIMEMLGCTSPYGLYSQGVPLIGNKRHDFITAANWDSAAVIDNRYVMVFSTAVYNFRAFEIRERTGYVLAKGRNLHIMNAGKNNLVTVITKLSEFYK